MNHLRRAGLVVLAVLFLVEAWIWDLFTAFGRWLASVVGLARLGAWIRRGILRLPPMATLPLFVIPAAAILPFKFLGVYLIARGHLVYGGLTFFAAKTVGLGLTALLFDLCRDKLLSIGWFAELYRRVMAVRTWAHELTAPVRARVAALRAKVRAWLGQGRFGRRVLALRARIRRRAVR